MRRWIARFVIAAGLALGLLPGLAQATTLGWDNGDCAILGPNYVLSCERFAGTATLTSNNVNFTAAQTRQFWEMTNSGTAMTATLPNSTFSSSSLSAGPITIYDADATAAVTISVTGGGNIVGNGGSHTSYTLNAGYRVTFIPDLVGNWLIYGESAHPGAPANQAILSAGSGNWTVPTGVHAIWFNGICAGGGGGGVSTTANAASASGGGGEYNQSILEVAPGDVIPYSISSGANGGAAGNNAGSTPSNCTFGPEPTYGWTLTLSGGVGGNGSASGAATGLANSTIYGGGLIHFYPANTNGILTLQDGMPTTNNGLAAGGGVGGGAPWGLRIVSVINASGTACVLATYGPGTGGGATANTGSTAQAGGKGCDGQFVLGY